FQVKTSRLVPAFERIPDRAGDQIRGVSRDPLGRHSAVTYVHRAVRARPYVDAQVEAERQRRAIKGAAQVRASRRHTDGNLLGHRSSNGQGFASRFLLHRLSFKSKAKGGRQIRNQKSKTGKRMQTQTSKVEATVLCA